MKQLIASMPVLLLSLLSRPALAQQDSSIPKEKRIYVGLQWTQGRYEVLFPAKDVGIQPMDNLRYTLGYWIWPRLALQTSFIWSQDTYSTVAYGTNSSGASISEGFVNTKTGTAVPVLLRYTLTRKPDHRVQFDILGGMTAVFAKYTFDLTNTEAGVITREYHISEQADGTAYLTTGLSSRYRVFHRLNIVADATWSKNPRSVSSSQHIGQGNRWGITKSLSIGLNYPFSLNRHNSKQ